MIYLLRGGKLNVGFPNGVVRRICHARILMSHGKLHGEENNNGIITSGETIILIVVKVYLKSSLLRRAYELFKRQIPTSLLKQKKMYLLMFPILI